MSENIEEGEKSAVVALKNSYRQLYRLGMIDREQYKKMIELIDKQDGTDNKKPTSEQK